MTGGEKQHEMTVIKVYTNLQPVPSFTFAERYNVMHKICLLAFHSANRAVLPTLKLHRMFKGQCNETFGLV